jgi:hypothetical protein
MKPEADVSLESDRLEQLLESPVPAPVVVVQEHQRGVPWWLLIPLLFTVPFCAILIYHRLVVEPTRAQARDAIIALDNLTALRAAAPANVPATGAGGTAAGAASRSGSEPAVLDPIAGISLPPAFDGIGLPGLVVTQSDPSVAKAPESTAADPGAPEAGTGAGSPPVLPGAAGARNDPGKTDAARMPAGPVADTSGNAAKPPALVNGFDDDREFHLDAPDGGFKERRGPAAPGSARPEARKPPSLPGERALPTLEENKRELVEEANRIKEDLATRMERRNEDLRVKSSEDRAVFRDELRNVIARDGKRAGPEIDKLARSYSNECDQTIVARAWDYWSHRGTSTEAKVRRLRSVGLPESVILDFMSAELHQMIGTRNGPRDKSEVRYRAALRLLQYKVGEKGSAAQADGDANGAQAK